MTSIRPWRAAGMVLAVIVAAACNDNSNITSSIVPPGPPTGLVYQLNLGEAVGSNSVIEPGVLLSWLPPNPDSTVSDFVVYGSDSADNAGFLRRAITTSISFHDAGTPQVQYYVTSQDVNGVESQPSNVVVVDASDTVQTPTGLAATALDSGALLAWSNNSITGSNGSHFDFYRVYSDAVINTNQCDPNGIALEGQSVSNGFVILGVANDVSRCYWVTAVTLSGHESQASDAVIVTPTSTDPPYTSMTIPANFTVIKRHPIALHRSFVKMRP